MGSRVQVVGCRVVGCTWCKESMFPTMGTWDYGTHVSISYVDP